MAFIGKPDLPIKVQLGGVSFETFRNSIVDAVQDVTIGALMSLEGVMIFTILINSAVRLT